MPAPTQHRTLCNRDCPDACALVATVVDGRVVKLEGAKDHPITRGFLCPRTRRFPARQHSSERLFTPLVRSGGKLKTASFDAAIDVVAERLSRIRDAHGPAAICHYRSGGNLGQVMTVTDRFWAAFGPVTTTRGDICSGAGSAAQKADFGAVDSNDLLDLHHAKHIVLWGKNLATSSPHTLAVVKRAQAEVTLVDPVWHQTAQSARHFIQPRPGADVALALATGRLLLEAGAPSAEVARTLDGLASYRALCERRSVAAWCALADVPVSAAEHLAARYLSGPTASLIGWGLGRTRAGYAAVRAIDALALISGNVGRRGGGATFSFSRKNVFTKADAGCPPPPRTLVEPLLGRELRDAEPKVRALWVTAANPVAMLPESHVTAAALDALDLLVVADSFLTDTAERAHVVFAVPTLLEADELMGSYGHHYLGVAEPVVAPPPQVRSDLQIVQALAARFGLGDVVAGSAEAWKERLLVGDLTLDTLKRGPIRNPRTPQVAYEGGRFSTPTGRAQLLAELPPLEHSTDAAYPLALLSLSSKDAQSSQWSVPQAGPARVRVHPSVFPAGPARLCSRSGSLVVQVVHDERQRDDVAIIPKGGHLRSGRCANRLITAALTDAGEGAALYGEPVALRPV